MQLIVCDLIKSFQRDPQMVNICTEDSLLLSIQTEIASINHRKQARWTVIGHYHWLSADREIEREGHVIAEYRWTGSHLYYWWSGFAFIALTFHHNRPQHQLSIHIQYTREEEDFFVYSDNHLQHNSPFRAFKWPQKLPGQVLTGMRTLHDLWSEILSDMQKKKERCDLSHNT